MPRLSAFASLEPASSPATTKSVFLLTLPATFAPSASNFSFASLRVSCANLPVKTIVFPAKMESFLSTTAFALYKSRLTPSCF